jgi:hypothetical protein
VSCVALDGTARPKVGSGLDQSLEAYARAVRAYQNAVLELQNAESVDPVILRPFLERAAAAKGLVNRYRVEHRGILPSGQDASPGRAELVSPV